MRTASAPEARRLLAAFQDGQFAEVARTAGAYIDGSDGDELVLSLLGMALMELQRPVEAERTYRSASQRFPGSALHWNNLGTALRSENRLQDAEMAYAEALRIEPSNAGYLVNMGFLQLQLGRVAQAGEYLCRAFQIDPANLEARVYGARMCMECGDDVRAHAMLDDWRGWSTGLGAELAVELGSQLIQLGKGADGEWLLRRYADDPLHGALARVRLVAVLERVNRMDKAKVVLESLPPPERVTDETLAGEIAEASAIIAIRDHDLPLARDLLERRLEQVQVDRWRTSAWFLLGKICDDQCDYPAAMDYLRRAHASQAKVLKQLVPELLQPEATPLRIAQTFLTHQQVDRWSPIAVPDCEASPIFVVGFPRSGTTMLEQMLDAHPDLQSMDERAFLHQVADRMQELGLSYPEDLGALTTAQATGLREGYWTAVADAVTLRPGQRLVDKNPLNMLLLPLMVRLFPEARVVFVVRHPCDVILSCYMQQFRAPRFAAVCSTLESLARSVASAMRFWIHHVDLLQPQCFEWCYEDVVADFEPNLERLGAFIGLGDASPLRNFSSHARQKGYISTPSYSQVVKPIYGGSVRRWEHYRDVFEDVLPVLEPALEHWRYRI